MSGANSSKRRCGAVFHFVYLLTALVVIINLVFSVRDNLAFSLSDLPQGDLLYSVESPDGYSTLAVYSIHNALGRAIRADADLGGQTVTVYWQTGIDGADARWLDSNIVEVNGVVIDVASGGTYDCRRGYSLFNEGSLEGSGLSERR